MVMIVMVVMMAMRTDGFEGWGGAAAVGGLAASGLKLDRCVGDVEAIAQSAVDAREDAEMCPAVQE